MKSLATVLVTALALAACGRDAPDAKGEADEPARAAPTKTIRVHPESTTLAPSASALFTASPASIGVTWSVREAGGGSISAAGLYTAPATAGTYHVVATSGAVSGEAIVTISPPVSITMASSYTTPACDPIRLSATVTGAADTSVIWALLDPACGTLTEYGEFRSVRGTGTCNVTATARADTTKIATTTITVATERILGVTVAPVNVSLVALGTQQFAATVQTSCGVFPAGG